MKKRAIVGVSLLLILIGGGAFAEGVDLPEPVFHGTGNQAEAIQETLSLAPGISAQDFQELVYLWSLESEGPSEVMTFTPLYTLAAAASPDAQEIPHSIRNNAYYQESVRLTKLAQENYDYGDYDASTNYAEEATRYAQLSDEYIAVQLRIKAASDALAAANSRLAWATANKAEERYPKEYAEAEGAYDEAETYMDDERWEDARDSANRSIAALANVEALAESERQGDASQVRDNSRNALPAQYTVRPWAISKDCLWNIAGRSWAYGDPNKWKILYSANRNKMPEPNNPDLIHPGMVLDIPSVDGETRSGMWSAGSTYTPIR